MPLTSYAPDRPQAAPFHSYPRPVTAGHRRVRRYAWLRGTAWACLVLLTLASVRGLVPGICANLWPSQDAAVVYGADSVVGSIGACCAELGLQRSCPLPGNPRHTAPFPGGIKDCAFCKLASARVVPLVFVVFETPRDVIAATPVAAVSLLHTQWTGHATSVRGPPALHLS